MEISHLRTFLHVFKTGSFSEAAKLVYRSQPAVSLQIKELETELGVRLFERYGPLKVKPTKEGLTLRELVLPIAMGFNSIKNDFEKARDPSGVVEIKVATHEAVITYLLPDLVERFRRKHPKVSFSFLRLSKDDIVSTILDGGADIGITTLEKVPHGIIYQKFSVHKRVLICPKNHPLAELKTVSPKDIAKYPLILPPLHSETRNIIDQVFRKEGLTYKLAMELAAREAVKIYVTRGFGISILNDYYLFPEDKKKLTEIDVSKDFGTTERGLLYRKGKTFSALQTAFIEQILKSSGILPRERDLNPRMSPRKRLLQESNRY